MSRTKEGHQERRYFTRFCKVCARYASTCEHDVNLFLVSQILVPYPWLTFDTAVTDEPYTHSSKDSILGFKNFCFFGLTEEFVFSVKRLQRC